MVRPARTTAQIKEEILRNVAVYTCARTDWEGERRESKKKALRTAARLMRQLCERGGHRIGKDVAGFPSMSTLAEQAAFKCPVCDPSGDAKREVNTGADVAKARAAEAYDVATGKKPKGKVVLDIEMCAKCYGLTALANLDKNGVCSICRDTPAGNGG